MKFQLLILIFVCTVGMSQAPNEYKVVRVVGKVESPSLKREVRTGDIIQSKDQLRFTTSDSYIVVISPQTGRKKISGVPDNTARELLDLLQSFVQPELKSTSSRNISMLYLESLQSSLAYDKLLVLGDGYIPVNTQKLSLKKPAIIRDWYDQNKRMVYRPISDNSGFRLDIKSLFGDTPPTPLPKVIIEYFEDEKEEPAFSPGILLAGFVPVYTDEPALVLELTALLSSASQKGNYAAQLLEIKRYLEAEYAGVQEDNLKAWLKNQGVLSE